MKSEKKVKCRLCKGYGYTFIRGGNGQERCKNCQGKTYEFLADDEILTD